MIDCPRCGRSVPAELTVEMPNERICDDCYGWLETLMDEAAEFDEEPIEFDDRSV